MLPVTSWVALDWGGPRTRRVTELPGSSSRLPRGCIASPVRGFSPFGSQALRSRVSARPRGPHRTRWDASPSAAGLTRGPLSPGFRGGFLGPLTVAPSLRGVPGPGFSPGPPLARGIRGEAPPESGHGSALVFPALGSCVMVFGIPAARRLCASRPGSGGLSYRPARLTLRGSVASVFSVAETRGARPAHGGRCGHTALRALHVWPLRAALGPPGALFRRVLRGYRIKRALPFVAGLGAV